MSIPVIRNIRIKKFIFSVIFVTSLGFIVYSLHGFWVQYAATHRTPIVVQPDNIITYSTDTPDETLPLCEESNFSASQPRYIDLPTIGASGCIQKIGIDQHNNMAVPNNIHLAGWYINSAKPGQGNLSIIDGHSGGRYLDGIFKHLADLKIRDQFTVEFGNKSIKTFQVVSVTNYSVDEAAKKMLEQDADIQSQLNLITCGSSYNNNLHKYEDRILVVARNVEST